MAQAQVEPREHRQLHNVESFEGYLEKLEEEAKGYFNEFETLKTADTPYGEKKLVSYFLIREVSRVMERLAYNYHIVGEGMEEHPVMARTKKLLDDGTEQIMTMTDYVITM